MNDLRQCCASFSVGFGAVQKDVALALSCDAFSDWRRFRALANELFAGSLDEEGTQDVLQLAHDLSYSYAGASEEFDSVFSFFHNWIHEFAAFLRGDAPEHFDAIVTYGYCYYGYLTAVVVLHIFNVEPDYAGLRWLMLGEESSIDFASSSGWPVRFDHIAANSLAIPKVQVVPRRAVNPDGFPTRPVSSPEIVVQHFPMGHGSLDIELSITFMTLFPSVRVLVFPGIKEMTCRRFELCSLDGIEEVDIMEDHFPRTVADVAIISWLSDMRRLKSQYASHGVEPPSFLLYLGHPLSQDRTVHLRPDEYSFGDLAADWALAAAENVWQGGRRFAVVAESLFLSRMIEWEVSLRVPVARPLTLWAPPWQPRRQEFLVVDRGKLDVNLPLAALLQLWTANSSVRVARQEPGTFMPFSEISGYRGAIFVPWSPETYSFRELTAMVMPTFVPAATWLLRCAMSHYNRAKRTAGTRWEEALDFAAAHGNAKIDPPTANLPFWLALTDYATVPGVVYFESVPDLVRRLHEPLNVDELRKYVRRSLLDAHSFWAPVLTALATGESLA